MFRLLVTLIMGSLMTWGVLQMVAGNGPIPTDEPDVFVFLPIVQRPYPRPVINNFQANVTTADPGDTIELRWETSNAVTVTLYHLMPTGQFGSFWHVSPTGMMTYTISPLARNHSDFALFASNAGGQWTQASVQIMLVCPDVWFFNPAPQSCPATAAETGPGAEQLFEHGRMLWVESQDLIYVLFDDGQTHRWYPYLDVWEEGMLEIDPTIVPPAGYYQPSRGFGLVWREQPYVRERLGWAVEVESGYETAVQRTSNHYSDTYIRAADGHVWRLLPEFSGWEKLFVETAH